MAFIPAIRFRLELLPDGRAELTADRPDGCWRDFAGMLEGKTNGARLTIEEIDEAIAEAGAAAGLGAHESHR